MSEATVPAVAAEQAVDGLGSGRRWLLPGVPGAVPGPAPMGATTAEAVMALESSAEEVDAEDGTGRALAAELTAGLDLDWGTMPLGLLRR